DTKGSKEFEIVYANRGTAKDLENLDVKGKLVLIDINQREDWWINYPSYQAHLKGAAAVIAVQNGGYAEVDDSALNAQDICGPDDAPAFSMSRKNAKELKKVLKANNNSVKVSLDAKSTVKMDQPTYNYYGKIEGTNKESYILLSAHYDSYFDGFQDDNSAIGLMLGIAKAMKETGYKPEKTIIFNALAAEEWGVSNTRYDWSTGAFNQIFKVHPEWAKQTFANINFELPAFEHMDANEIRSVYEFKDFLTDFATTVPKVDGIYKDGIKVVTPLQTWSDDFSFSIAGIPAIRNDFQDSQFMHTHYHSQYDDQETYNKKVMKYHMNMYGTLAMQYDKQAVTPLHFTTRLDEMQKTIDEKVNGQSDDLEKAIAQTKELAVANDKKVDEVNASYKKAYEAGDMKEAQKILTDHKALNDQLLATFKQAQDDLVRLTWEDEVIFPHEHAQNNITNLSNAVTVLKAGKVTKALDDSLYLIDNNWYAYDFEKEVYDYFTNYVTDQPADRLMWGAGRIVGHEDLYDV
ncbi:MAG: M28 family peptidase, partial [Kurthia sp.]